MLFLAASRKHVLTVYPLPPPAPAAPVWSGGLTATVASYVIHSGRNGVLTEKWRRRPRFNATASETLVWQEGIYNICRPAVCSSNYSEKDGLTEIIFFGFCSQTGPQQTIRLGVVVGRSGQGGGPFVAERSKDGPSKLVTLWWISSCRLLAPLPFLSSPWPSRLQAPLSRRREWKNITLPVHNFNLNSPTNRQCSIFVKGSSV